MKKNGGEEENEI